MSGRGRPVVKLYHQLYKPSGWPAMLCYVMHRTFTSALRSEDVNNIIYLSDSAPDGLSSALRSFPLATKVSRRLLFQEHCQSDIQYDECLVQARPDCIIYSVRHRATFHTLLRNINPFNGCSRVMSHFVRRFTFTRRISWLRGDHSTFNRDEVARAHS